MKIDRSPFPEFLPLTLEQKDGVAKEISNTRGLIKKAFSPWQLLTGYATLGEEIEDLGKFLLYEDFIKKNFSKPEADFILLSSYPNIVAQYNRGVNILNRELDQIKATSNYQRLGELAKEVLDLNKAR